MPEVEEIGQDFPRRRAVGPDVFPLGEVLIGNMVVDVEDLAADQAFHLADAAEARRIEDDGQPGIIRFDLVRLVDVLQAVEEVIAVVDIVVDDHDGLLPLQLQPVPECQEAADGVAIGTDMGRQQDLIVMAQ